MGFSCLKATEPLQGVSLLFTTDFPYIPGTHLINLGRWMADQSTLDQLKCFELGIHWESSALTIRDHFYINEKWCLIIFEFELVKIIKNNFSKKYLLSNLLEVSFKIADIWSIQFTVRIEKKLLYLRCTHFYFLLAHF